MDYAKISVIIVTYRQADVIGRNLDSILNQKEYGLYEIVICDDCSPDNNWEVIQSYAKRYPNIIRAYRNEQNMGIYGNSIKAASLHGDADLFCWLEGDDALCDGFFKAAQDFIHKHKINLLEPIGIFSDYYAIDLNNKKRLKKNDFVLRKEKPYSSYLRNMASWRASLFTKQVISTFHPVELNKGLMLAETLFDAQWFRYIKNAYYNDVAGSIYYTGIGVSAKWGLSNSISKYKVEENIIRWQYLLDNGMLCEKEDIFWAYSQIAYSSCLQKLRVKQWLRFNKYYIKGLKHYKMSFLKLLLKNLHLFVLVMKK